MAKIDDDGPVHGVVVVHTNVTNTLGLKWNQPQWENSTQEWNKSRKKIVCLPPMDIDRADFLSMHIIRDEKYH